MTNSFMIYQEQGNIVTVTKMRECTHYFSVGNGMKGDAIAMDILLRREETFATSRGNNCSVVREQLLRREEKMVRQNGLLRDAMERRGCKRGLREAKGCKCMQEVIGKFILFFIHIIL